MVPIWSCQIRQRFGNRSNMDILPLFPNRDPQPTEPQVSRQASSSGNLAGLNLLRVVAAVGVVLLHSSVPYLQHAMPGLDWPVREAASPLIDCVFWAIEVFIMPVFLLVAGILAWQTMVRRGATTLLISRTKRLGKPLLFGLCVVLPIDLYIWVGGWVYEGWVDPVKLKSFKIDGPLGDNLWGTSHLWFLLYLLTYVACLATAAKWLRPSSTRQPSDESTATSNRWYVSIAATIVAVGVITLSVRPEVVWGFQHDFLPVPSKWIYSATFFAGGALLASRASGLSTVRQHSVRMAIPSLMCLVAAVLLGRWMLHGHENSSSTTQLAEPSLALITTIAAWGVTLSLVGLSMKYIRSTSTAVSYLATASFWVYLVHHPFVALAHIDLKYLLPTMAVELKWAISFALSLGASLMTYEAFVRKTKLGQLLGLNWNAPEPSAEEPIMVAIPTSPATDNEGVRRAA